MGGAFETGLRNRVPVDLSYRIRSGNNLWPGHEAEDTVMDLKALGAEYVVVHGPKSQEYYRDFARPERLVPALQEVYRMDDDTIYALPPRRLAFLLRPEEVADADVLEHREVLARYVAAGDDEARPALSSVWTGSSRLAIAGAVRAGDVVSVQVNADPGWRATQDGRPIAITQDALGFVVLHPAPVRQHAPGTGFRGHARAARDGRSERAGLVRVTRLALAYEADGMTRGHMKTLLCALLLFLLNAAIVMKLFAIDYTVNMGSIEAAYIGLTRYIANNWGDLRWFPLWYGGIPYPDSYPPLLHFLSALMVSVTHVSPGLAHHFVSAIFYCLGPVALFWMAWRLCRSRECAFAAAFFYSLISPSCLLIETIRVDSDGYLSPRRLRSLVLWGEGPHITSMCLVAFAVGMLHVALEKRKPWYWVGAAVAIAAVPLSNWLGAAALAICLSAYLAAGLPDGQKTRPILVRTAAVGLFAYALAVPWLSPATIAVIRANAPRVATYFKSTPDQRVILVCVAVLYLLGVWAMERLRVPRHIRFALLVSLVTGSVTLVRYWTGISLFPQPERYHLEMDMFFWVAAAFLVWPAVRWASRRVGRRQSFAVAIVIALLGVPIVKKQRRESRWIERTLDIRSTIEYKTSKWLEANMPGSRVFAPGTIGFWLNAFSDTPQITGGFDNGIVNQTLPNVIFEVYAGERQDTMLDLLNAFGCDAVIGGGKHSAEFYHPVKYPQKFDGLKALWRDGGDAIYEVPRRSRGLAHVMRKSDLPELPMNPNGFDVLLPYLAGLNNAAYPPATMKWQAPSRARVTADLQPDQIVSVQISWDKGWNATVGGRSVPLWEDKLGQVAVEPHCSGPCTVELLYDGGLEGKLARLIQFLAILTGALWIAMTIWRKRSGSTITN